jgi:thimet oligopeptidase
LLGFATFANLATADQMMGSTTKLKAFLAEVDAASKPIADRENAQLMAFVAKADPKAGPLTEADGTYWREQYRRAAYDFDSQSVRPFFPYEEVQAGVLAVAARLFHLRFEAVRDAAVWDPGVSTFDVYDAAGTGGARLGRIYLDMHPRTGKDKWFSSAPVTPGIAGRQLPEGALICNFSGGQAGDPGLMDYDDVVTFFHEFGHLMHHILGSQGRWSGQGGFNVEGDFVEAPSQMLEELFRDTTVLQSFAKQYRTGETLPAATIAKMNLASAYGRGAWMQGQLFYATYSLQVHDQPPAQIDLQALFQRDQRRFMPFLPLPDAHAFASFTHLTGYASNYYTYVLDKVIAVDFFDQFDRTNLLDGPAASRYRHAVLEPGATKPAADLVHDFLGRPQKVDALTRWMNVELAKP